MKKKELREWILLLALQIAWIAPCVYDYTTKEEVQIEDEWIEEMEDIIRWRIDDVEEEIYIEEVDAEIVQKKPDSTSLGQFRLTAYCACEKCCFEFADGITASGTVATEGRTVAVDPSIIPYGTVLIINGHEYIAEDCSVNYIHGNEIDIFFNSHDAALEFGIQYAEIFIKESN